MVTGSDLPSPVLPLEVIYEILEIFIQNERQDLRSIRACSLVCRHFVPPCQALIFSKLDVFVPHSGNLDGDFPNKQTRTSVKFSSVNLILQLTLLYCTGVSSNQRSTPLQGFVPYSNTSRKRNKIQTLRLYSLHSRRKAFKDARPFDDFQIMPFIKRLEIHNIHLSNASDLFSSCTNLKEVQLDLASKSNDMDSSDTKFRPRIELYDDYTYLDTFHAPDVINFSNIRVFKIYPGISDGPERFKSLLKLCAGTVEELHLKKMQCK
ncbi:hypothetical protein CPB84DRAFT_271828 [Gymnopilus junonius]|uniref:Uncharacterized protein n=1 Tax=Gymnopilus junonius TaxID=109634 RepID=A0A9P5TSG2_GYMJU|nr:hypothetical protein CPB84DRAFT_271828 [Gymnopilus junonius]